MKILHIIGGLNTGGAEMMLYKMVEESNKMGHQSMVISLMDMGNLSGKILALGTPVKAVGLVKKRPNPFLLIKLVRWIKEFNPDAIQTWMYHSDLLGGLIAKFILNKPVVWGVHQSNFDPKVHKWLTHQIARICALISPWVPSKIVFCSEAGYKVHLQMGYQKDKMCVIPNGFSTDVFMPNLQARNEIRKELGISDEAVLFGLIGRFDPQKDHKNFIEAAGKVAKQYPQAYFLMAGYLVTRENDELRQQMDATGFGDRFFPLGRRTDVPHIAAALDVGVLSSRGVEAFPLVLGEMMLCEVPCVTTDVGDSGLIVSDTGITVPPMNADVFADAMKKMVEMGSEGRKALGKKARQRICDNYQIQDIVRRYLDLYSSLA